MFTPALNQVMNSWLNQKHELGKLGCKLTKSISPCQGDKLLIWSMAWSIKDDYHMNPLNLIRYKTLMFEFILRLLYF